MTLKIAVIGAGGVGGYFGGKLADAGCDVTLVARGAHLQAIQQQGLRIEDPDGNVSTREISTLDSNLGISGQADVIIIAVKGSQLEEAGQLAKSLCHSNTLILPLLNGISAPDVLNRGLPDQTVLGGLCGIIAQIGEPGLIKHVGIDPFVTFGLMQAQPSLDSRVADLKAAFENAGLKATVPEDISLSMWRKYLFICPLSAATSVSRVTIGEVRSTPESMHLLEQLVDETLAVGVAAGIPLTNEHRDSVITQVSKSPVDGTTSMQRDIRDGKPSELETQLGPVIALGKKHSVETPALSFAYSALKPQELLHRKQSTK